MTNDKKSDFLNISKSIQPSHEKQLKNLIVRKAGSNIDALKNIHHAIAGFLLLPPASRQQGKLQFKFKQPLDRIESSYCHEFSQMPLVAQNTIKALAFLFSCFKYHGYCINKSEFPILKGAGLLESHLGLYNENDEFIVLGHSYDDETFEPPLSIPKVEPCLNDDILIYPQFCEIIIDNNDQKTLKALYDFLEEDFLLPVLDKAHFL